MPAPARRLRVALCLGLALPLAGSTLHAQRKTFEQQMQENQQRLEGIRRERSEVQDVEVDADGARGEDGHASNSVSRETLPRPSLHRDEWRDGRR